MQTSVDCDKKCHVMIVIITDPSPFCHNAVGHVWTVRPALRPRVWASRSHVPSSIVTTKPSRTGLRPLNIHLCFHFFFLSFPLRRHLLVYSPPFFSIQKYVCMTLCRLLNLNDIFCYSYTWITNVDKWWSSDSQYVKRRSVHIANGGCTIIKGT